MGGILKREGIYIYIYTYMYVYIYLRLTQVVVWQKPTQHCKAIILQLEIYIYIHTHTYICMEERNRSANVQIIGVSERENINRDEEIFEGMIGNKFS